MAMGMEVGSPAYEERMDALMAARLAEPLFGDPAGHFTTLEGLLERQGDFDLLDKLDRNAGNGERQSRKAAFRNCLGGRDGVLGDGGDYGFGGPDCWEVDGVDHRPRPLAGFGAERGVDRVKLLSMRTSVARVDG